MSDTQRQPTCAERIESHFEGRREDIEAMMRALRAGDADDLPEGDCDHCGEPWADHPTNGSEASASEHASNLLHEYGLSIEVKRVLKFQLSSGGPADWFEAELDEDGSVSGIEYHFSDWFDHAQMDVRDDTVQDWLNYYAEVVAQ